MVAVANHAESDNAVLIYIAGSLSHMLRAGTNSKKLCSGEDWPSSLCYNAIGPPCKIQLGPMLACPDSCALS